MPKQIQNLGLIFALKQVSSPEFTQLRAVISSCALLFGSFSAKIFVLSPTNISSVLQSSVRQPLTSTGVYSSRANNGYLT